MLYDPVEQRLFKPDIMTGLLALDPLVAEDFLTLRQKLFVEKRFPDEVVILGSRCCHVMATNF